MRIKYLGTAAAEGIPAIFCDCELCKKARELGGKNIRTRSQSLINDDLIIDWSADSYLHILNGGFDEKKIKYILITHNHMDHYYDKDFYFLHPGFSHPNESFNGVSLIGNEDIEQSAEWLAEYTSGSLKYIKVALWEPLSLGKYTIVPLRANHGTPHPLNYIIGDGAKTILYCHDTGRLFPEVKEFLLNAGFKFDLVSLDCTEGNVESIPYEGHMCVAWDIDLKNWLIENGLADNNTKFVLNHFSHNGKDSLYDDMVKIGEESGFITSFDGLEVEI